MSKQESWVDHKFLQRLQARLVRPGVVHLDMGPVMMSRMEQMTQPQPLVQAVGQRWQSSFADQQAQLPFVYAQPAPPAMPERHTAVSNSHPTTTVKPTKTRPLAQPALDNDKVATNPTSAEFPVASQTTTATKDAAMKPTAVINPMQPAKTEQSTTGMATSLPLNIQPQPPAQTSPPTPTQKEATVPVTRENTASENAASASLVSQPLPIVKAKRSMPATAVSHSAPPPKQVNGTPPAAVPPADKVPLVLVAPQADTPAKRPTGQQAAPSPQINQAERPLVHPRTQATTAPARPVVRPRATARKAPISFPSAAPNPVTANGRSQTSSLAVKPLPVVRTEQSQASPSPQALPLPKTAVVTPSYSSQPAPAAPVTSSSAGSGVIQRSPTDEAPEATSAPAETVDINEIVAEVQRQFMRELAIEGERRGVTSWY